MPLAPEQIPSPFAAEDGRLGGEESLPSKLWKQLIGAPKGKPLTQLAQEVGVENEKNVEIVLDANDHFCQVEGGYYMLSIHCSLKWGVAGVGKISDDFIAAASMLPGVELQACAASSSLERATQFKERHGFRTAHASYENLAIDPNVDIVYVGNVHPQHRETVLLMLDAGKHVLCEKPITLCAAHAQELVDSACAKKLFLLEGHWDRLNPVTAAARMLAKTGAIGDIRHVSSEFTMSASESIERLYKRELGGGALLDIGCYPLSFVQYIYEGQEPEEVHAAGHLQDGIDVQGTALFKYKDGLTASTMWSFKCTAANSATIFGSEGRIEVPDSHAPSELTLIQVTGSGPGAKQEATTFKFPGPPVPESVNHGDPGCKGMHFPSSELFIYEAMAVQGAVLNGNTELTGEVPLHQTVSLMALCDTIREQLGVMYDTADGPV